MSVELYRRARRAEASAARAPERRRLRLEFFRQALAEGYDSLKVRHAEGASGQESVRTHARLMDDVILSLTRLIAASPSATASAAIRRARTSRAAPPCRRRASSPDRRLFARFQRVLRQEV